MKSSDKMILLGLAIVAALAGVWFLVIAPKRDEVAKLDDEIATLEQSVSEQEALASQAEAAEADFDEAYSAMVRLGKAVPADSDTASLIDQVEGISSRARTDFLSLTLTTEGDASATAAAPAPTPTDGTVPATESSVALQPLGAQVGPAGLMTMPYDLTFEGDFFGLSKFFAGLDGLVHVDNQGQLVTRGSQAARGRLLTIDGFSLSLNEEGGASDLLSANVSLTSYLTPPDQGATAGATGAGPAVEVPGETTAPATTDATATPAPTAAVTP
ncbi:hypothetical protein HJD18_08720 [Thermoleophilia bacterium SCSIO 60948]|nr:hypothetical protein HJD18_08720 [Thermoleophilia bacterium SCSIO 60948]